VAWGSAWLAGRVSLERAAAAVQDVDEEQQTEEGDGIERLLTRLRSAGARTLALVLPVPGDVSGLPGAGDQFAVAAVEAGEGVVASGPGARWGVVPASTKVGPVGDQLVLTTWSVFAIAADAAPTLHLSIGEAEEELVTALRSATRELASLEAARWHDGLAEPVAGMRRRARRGEEAASGLPETYPARAANLLARADRLQTVLMLAGAAEGSSWTTADAQARSSALRELSVAVRHARQAAYNSYPTGI
jgi:hypothetical protein